LGLFITKSIVEAHGGKIAVASQEGAWAEFTFTLPKCKESPPGKS
jgi:two-component system sensor histidine kinase PhcS